MKFSLFTVSEHKKEGCCHLTTLMYIKLHMSHGRTQS